MLEGFLAKQGAKGLSKSYQRRFFRLDKPAELHYYKAEKIPQGRSQGFIDLNKVISVKRGSESMPSKRSTWMPRSSDVQGSSYFFDVVTEDRVYHLAASTEPELLRWVDGISSAVRTLHPPSDKLSPSPVAKPPISPDVSIAPTEPSPRSSGSLNGPIAGSPVQRAPIETKKEEAPATPPQSEEQEEIILPEKTLSMEEAMKLLCEIDNSLEKENIDTIRAENQQKFTDKDVSLLDQQSSTAELFQQLCAEEREIVQQIQAQQTPQQEETQLTTQQVFQEITTRLKRAAEQLKREINTSDQQNAGANLKQLVQQSKEIQTRISSDSKQMVTLQERMQQMDVQLQSLPGASELDDNELATQLKSLQIRRKVIHEGLMAMKEGDVASSDIDHLQHELDHIDHELEEVNASLVASAEQSGNETRESLTKKREQLQSQLETLDDANTQRREELKRIQKVIGWLSSTRRQSMRPGANLQSLGTLTSPDLPEAFAEAAAIFQERQTFVSTTLEHDSSIRSLSARRADVLLRRMALVEKLFTCCSEAYNDLPTAEGVDRSADFALSSIFRSNERERSLVQSHNDLRQSLEDQREQTEAMSEQQQQRREQDQLDEINQLKEQLATTTEQLHRSEETVKELQDSLESRQSALREAEKKLDDKYISSLESELVQREAELAKLSELHRKVEEEQDLERHDVAASRQQFSELQKELKAKDQVILALRDLNKTTPGSPIPPEEARQVIAKLKAANVAHQTQNAHLMQELDRIRSHYKAKVEGREQTIESLQSQLDAIRSKFRELRHDSLSKSGIQDDILESAEFVKQEYFYSMALGMKLDFCSRGTPANVNVAELFQEALTTVPVQEWNKWLSQKFEDEVERATSSPPRAEGIQAHLTPKRTASLGL